MTTNGFVTVDSTKQFDSAVLDHMLESLDVSDLGEGLRLVNKTTKELDHDFAKHLLELAEFDPDRPLDDNHVARLKSAMERGTFLSEQVNIITCTTGGKEYRMNGQHTCWARLYMPEKYRCPISYMRYAAKTENDMRRLYASIDRNKARSKGNVICSYLYGTEEWEGYSKAELKLLAEGMAFWLFPSDHHNKLRDGDDRAYLLMTDHKALGHKVGAFLQASKISANRHLFRSPVVGAMFATFSKPNAVEFWSTIRDGIGFQTKDDARLVLRNNLVSTSIFHGGGATSGKKHTSREEMYRWCIVAWNYWREGRPMKQLKANLHSERQKVS